jgi:hypothetical protein
MSAIQNWGHWSVVKLQTTNAYVLSLCRVRSLWHESQTRTSCVIPKWGSGRDFEEHFWSNTRPQLRQWCLRLVNENGSRQRRQTSESIHSGAVCVSTRAEPATARSSGGKLNPRNVVANHVWPYHCIYRTFCLQCLIYLLDITKVIFPLE